MLLRTVRRRVAPFLAGAVAAPLLSAVAGCSSPPPPPPPPAPTVVDLQISATADVNPTPDGRGAPVIVRVYQLGSKAAFERAEFYPLYNTDAATLGPDLVKKEEWLVIPRQQQVGHLFATRMGTAVGVFAAYQDFQDATWRATADIPAHQTTKVAVSADRGGIRLTTTREQPAGH